MKICILPYTQINGSWTVPDDIMAAVFEKMREENRVSAVFYEGLIVNPEQFVNMVKRPSNTVALAVDADSTDEKQLLAIAWLNGHGPGHAFAHFCTFSAARQITKDVGEAVFSFWWSMTGPGGNPIFRVIMGRTPANNRVATVYLRRIGMTVLGTVPSICWDAYERRFVGAVFSYKERPHATDVSV